MRPCSNRPAMLRVSLETQLQVEQPDIKTWFFLDGLLDERMQSIADNFQKKHLVLVNSEKRGLSKNILESLAVLFDEAEMDLVTIIEEDAVVAKDLFQMTEHAIRNFADKKTYSIVAGINLNGASNNSDPNILYRDNHLRAVTHTLLRSSWELLQEHSNEDYYKDPAEYLKKKFPGLYENAITDQAGLQQRIIETRGLHIIYPLVSRVGHIGVYGKNQGSSEFSEKSEEEQVKLLRGGLKDFNIIKPFIKAYEKNFGPFKQDVSGDKYELRSLDHLSHQRKTT